VSRRHLTSVLRLLQPRPQSRRELGHGSEALVKRIYGHLGTARHRAKVVEYRVEQHKKVLKEQLAAMRVGPGQH